MKPSPPAEIASGELVMEAPPRGVPAAPTLERSPDDLEPPRAAEVRACLDRVFGTAMRPSKERRRWFLDGDFNGDHCRDVAALVRPSPGALAAINDPLANWILEDPSGLEAARPGVGPKDELLAVVHGFGAQGWRSAEARQTYVLRDVAAGDLEAARSDEVVAGAPGEILEGHVLLATIRGRACVIGWNGARYVVVPRPPRPGRVPSRKFASVRGPAAHPF